MAQSQIKYMKPNGDYDQNIHIHNIICMCSFTYNIESKRRSELVHLNHTLVVLRVVSASDEWMCSCVTARQRGRGEDDPGEQMWYGGQTPNLKGARTSSEYLSTGYTAFKGTPLQSGCVAHTQKKEKKSKLYIFLLATFFDNTYLVVY